MVLMYICHFTHVRDTKKAVLMESCTINGLWLWKRVSMKAKVGDTKETVTIVIVSTSTTKKIVVDGDNYNNRSGWMQNICT